MRYGVCFGPEPDKVKIVKEAGFDYIESNFQIITKLDESDFLAYKNALNENNIKCEAVNCFMPNDFKVSTRDYDVEACKSFIEKGMSRGAEIGLKKVVFGSGGARCMSEGQDFKSAFLNLAYFLKEIVAPIAEKYQIYVVIEPLRFNECNMINTVKEGAMLAALADNEYIAVLADIYHMLGANDSNDNICDLKGLIKHAHISNPISNVENHKRIYPADSNEFDYEGFIEAIEYAGCDTCSVEADCLDLEKDVTDAARVLLKGRI